MASPSPTNNAELPIIWLLPPDASSHRIAIHPLPLAISATLASLIIIVLIILYHRKPAPAHHPHRSIELATLRNDIRVVRPEKTQPLQDPPLVLREDRTAAEHEPEAPHAKTERPSNDNSSTSLPSLDTTPVQDYHDYLRGSTHGVFARGSVDSPPPPRFSYTAPVYRENTNSTDCRACEIIVRASDTRPIGTAASSGYSVSIGPTPDLSRQNSLHKGYEHGVWTHLRLGSEYDGDRTFVPSEPNLRLGERKGKAG